MWEHIWKTGNFGLVIKWVVLGPLCGSFEATVGSISLWSTGLSVCIQGKLRVWGNKVTYNSTHEHCSTHTRWAHWSSSHYSRAAGTIHSGSKNTSGDLQKCRWMTDLGRCVKQIYGVLMFQSLDWPTAPAPYSQLNRNTHINKKKPNNKWVC